SLEPRKTKDDANPVIGIVHASSTKLAGQKDVGPSLKTPAELLSPAAGAEPALAFNDEIVGTTDPDDPTNIAPLADDPYKKYQKSYSDFMRRMRFLAGKDLTPRVKRDGGELNIKAPPAFRMKIGAKMEMGHIIATRRNSPAEEKIRLPETGRKFVKG